MTALTVLEIPVDGIVADPATGREAVMLNGAVRRVVFDVDSGAWRLLESQGGCDVPGARVWLSAPCQWTTDTPGHCTARPRLTGAVQRIELTAPPAVPASAKSLPRWLHYIWIGDTGLPEHLAGTITANAVRSGLYQGVLHVHAETDAGLARVQAQLRDAAVVVRDLRGDPAFRAFLRSPLGPYYRTLLQPATRNAGAASDMLRLALLHRYGGIYLDCDDSIAQVFSPSAELCAAPTDVLLNRWIGAHGLGYFGYNQSCFASQPGNPVLHAMLVEMATRLGEAEDFLRTPRPWRTPASNTTPGETSAMEAYILRTLQLTGPGLFNDVLQRCRPDYYHLELWLIHAYMQTTWSPSEPRYLANRYFDQMHAALAHYLPFSAGPFEVSIGNADTWNQPVPEPGTV